MYRNIRDCVLSFNPLSIFAFSTGDQPHLKVNSPFLRFYKPFPSSSRSSHAYPRAETSSTRRRRHQGVHGSPPLATDDLPVVAFELLRRDKCTLGVSHEAFSDARTKQLLVTDVVATHCASSTVVIRVARTTSERRPGGEVCATGNQQGMKGLVSLSLFESVYR